MFQFQTGSIKSRKSYEFNDGIINGFNSKLVRLKDQFFVISGYFVVLFQFQTGSIKSHGVFQQVELRRSFNSKLVRLKELCDPCPTTQSVEFQFQTGSIKSGDDGSGCYKGLVSIPNWFD